MPMFSTNRSNVMEVTVLETSVIERIATMAKEHAVSIICATLNIPMSDAEKVYKVLFG